MKELTEDGVLGDLIIKIDGVYHQKAVYIDLNSADGVCLKVGLYELTEFTNVVDVLDTNAKCMKYSLNTISNNIVQASNKIGIRSRRGNGNTILIHPDTLDIIDSNMSNIFKMQYDTAIKVGDVYVGYEGNREYDITLCKIYDVDGSCINLASPERINMFYIKLILEKNNEE